MDRFSEKLKPNNVYHIFNHGNADEGIFKEEKNYRFFLKKYDQYISPIALTYAYCLMPNHFHLLIQIRDVDTINNYFFHLHPTKSVEGNIGFSDFLIQQFKNFLNSYTKSFNRLYQRKGKLFLQSTKNRPIKNRSYFFNAINYIHQNPVQHGLANYPDEWKHSSYHSYLSTKPTKIQKTQVLKEFINIEAFKENQLNVKGLGEYELAMDLEY